MTLAFRWTIIIIVGMVLTYFVVVSLFSLQNAIRIKTGI